MFRIWSLIKRGKSIYRAGKWTAKLFGKISDLLWRVASPVIALDILYTCLNIFFDEELPGDDFFTFLSWLAEDEEAIESVEALQREVNVGVKHEHHSEDHVVYQLRRVQALMEEGGVPNEAIDALSRSVLSKYPEERRKNLTGHRAWPGLL